MTGTCQYCGCTTAEACAGGCAWANAEETLCTVCADAAETATVLVSVLSVTLVQEGATLRLVTNRFERLATADQATLVRLCRTLVEGMRQGLSAEVVEEAGDAIRQVDRISAFVLEHFPGDVHEDDSAASVVLRLLGRTVGSPLVLP